MGARAARTDPKAPASIEFPAGVIKTRKLDRWTWPADGDLLAALHAMERADLIRTKESPAKDGIKAEALIKDGTVVLSVNCSPGSPSSRERSWRR